MRRFPTAHIFMTEATAEIGSVLLHNSVNVMTRQREEIGRACRGVVSAFHASRNRSRIGTLALVSIASSESPSRASVRPQREKDALTFEFFDAGHVLGSSGILLRAEGKRSFTPGTSISTTKRSWKRQFFRKRRLMS
jgi:Cft2 family RNA processing exonuclease